MSIVYDCLVVSTSAGECVSICWSLKRNRLTFNKWSCLSACNSVQDAVVDKHRALWIAALSAATDRSRRLKEAAEQSRNGSEGWWDGREWAYRHASRRIRDGTATRNLAWSRHQADAPSVSLWQLRTQLKSYQTELRVYMFTTTPELNWLYTDLSMCNV